MCIFQELNMTAYNFFIHLTDYILKLETFGRNRVVKFFTLFLILCWCFTFSMSPKISWVDKPLESAHQKVRKMQIDRGHYRMCSIKKDALKDFARASFLINFNKVSYKKETLTQGFSCEFCKSFKNTFFIEHIRCLLLRLHCTKYTTSSPELFFKK